MTFAELKAKTTHLAKVDPNSGGVEDEYLRPKINVEQNGAEIKITASNALFDESKVVTLETGEEILRSTSG